jgi:hypothetical protein
MRDHDHICFEHIAFSAATEKGFKDVSIMTVGEADGHGMMVDHKTLEQFLQHAEGKTIPAYLTHAGALGADGRPKDRLGSEIGMFSGFYRDGDHIRAKSFEFLSSFKENAPQAHATLVELAKSFANQLGISPVLRQFRAWVTRTGEEIDAALSGGRPPDAVGNLPAMRVLGLKSCDFVQQPAANLGLFEAGIDGTNQNNTSTMSTETILLSKHTEPLTAKQGEITALQAQHRDAIAALETKHAGIVENKDKEIANLRGSEAKAKEDLAGQTAALAAMTKMRDDAAAYDMRKAGAPALQVALESRQEKIPTPAQTDKGRWEQYAALCEEVKDAHGTVILHKETPAAKHFKDTHLTRK